MSAQPASLTSPGGSSALDEETARAELYGLLSQLYYAAPSADLLSALRVAVTEAPADGAFLQEPWQVLVGAVRELSDAAIAQEFDRLFGGVGKPEVCKPEVSKNEPVVLSVLAQGPASFTQLREASGLNSGKLRYALNRAVDAGRVEMIGKQGDKDTVYQLGKSE